MRLTPRESDIQRAIVEAFALKHHIVLWPIDAGGKGFRAAKGNGGHSGIPAGFPDLLGFVHPSGRGLLIEVKAPGKKPIKHQVAFMEQLAWMGVMVFWADSVEMALNQFEIAQMRD